jgi:hypothetical protein
MKSGRNGREKGRKTFRNIQGRKNKIKKLLRVDGRQHHKWWGSAV